MPQGGEAMPKETKAAMLLPPGCPNLTDGQYCKEHEAAARRQYNKYERSADVNKKYGRAWKRIRDRYAAAHPLCEMCLKEGRLTPVDEVHHIVPISQGGTHARGQSDEPLPFLPYQDSPRARRPVGRSKSLRVLYAGSGPGLRARKRRNQKGN